MPMRTFLLPVLPTEVCLGFFIDAVARRPEVKEYIPCD
jgi:hypothetical protein